MTTIMNEKLKCGAQIECVGITHNMLLVDPGFMDKVKPGDRVTMVWDRDCIVDGNQSVSVFYKSDFVNIMGHVRRIYRQSVMPLIEKFGKVEGSIASVGSTSCMLNIDDRFVCDTPSAALPCHKAKLQPGVIDESLIVKSNREDTSLEMLADALINSHDKSETIELAQQYLNAYGHSLSGDHEQDFRQVMAKLQMLATNEGCDEVERLIVLLDEKNKAMTSGDNVVGIFDEQLKRLRRSAEVKGGTFDRLLSRHFGRKNDVPASELMTLKTEVENWLNASFDNLFYADRKTYIKRIAYESLSTRELYTIMTHILVSEFLAAKINEAAGVRPATIANDSNSKVRRAILHVMSAKDGNGFLINTRRQWMSIFRVLVDEGIVADNAFSAFSDYIRELFPDDSMLRVKLNANDMSKVCVGVFMRPYSEWDFRLYHGQKRVFDRYFNVARTFCEALAAAQG